MSFKAYEEDCPGCKPVLLDPDTMKVLGPDDPAVKVINAVWGKTTPEERRSFHDACCNNSRLPKDLAVLESIGKRFEAAMQASNAH
jgi:hypothetical protein